MTPETIHDREVLTRPGRPGADLVVLLHGGKSSAQGMSDACPIHKLDPFLNVAALQGTPDRDFGWLNRFVPDGWRGRHFHIGAGLQGNAGERRVDDVAHLDAVLDTLVDRWSPGRILLVGFSNGGHLALRYAALRLHMMPTLYVYTWGSVLAENPRPGVSFDGPVRVRTNHGTEDRLIPADGPVRIGGVRVMTRAETSSYFGAASQSGVYGGGHEVPRDGATWALEWFRGRAPLASSSA